VVRSNLRVSRRRLGEFCRRHHVQRLAFFGSVLREDFGPDSDVDVLVEFEPGHSPGWEIVAMEEELAQLLGRRVDLVTPKSLLSGLRARILASAVVQYEAPRAEE
jgi:predicted nucleotidyltransferase